MSSNEFLNPLYEAPASHPYQDGGDHGAWLFSETCNRMESDRAWLEAMPRAESTLLLRYFANQVHRVRDLHDYRAMLEECLGAVGVTGCMIPMLPPCPGMAEADHAA